MQFSASKFIASERVSVRKYDMLINTHCGESKTSLYQVARNLSISYAYARIVNETVKNTKKLPSRLIYAVLRLSQFINYPKT